MSFTIEKFQTDEERDEMLKFVRDLAPTRDRLLIELLIYTGARPVELTYLTKGMLYDKKQSVLIRGAKGSNDREIGIPSQLFNDLSAYAKTLNGDSIFPISVRRIQQIWDKYKVSHKPPRSSRHGAAVRAARRTKDPQVVRRLLGHKSIANTSKYLDYAIDADQFRRALK